MSGGPWLPITSARTLRACAEFPARADDVFICSYPKSGTTWCQNLVARILTRSRGDEPAPPESWSHVSEVSPFFEIDPHWDHGAEASSLAARVVENHRRFVRGRRVFNTHLPLALMPRVIDENENRLPKIVYVARDGRDCAVSFWHHLKSQSVEDGGWNEGWDTFFDAWIEGGIAFGSWFDHLNGWRDAATDENRRRECARWSDAVAGRRRHARLPVERDEGRKERDFYARGAQGGARGGGKDRPRESEEGAALVRGEQSGGHRDGAVIGARERHRI